MVNYVKLAHYVDANLLHYQLPGRSVTGILHLANMTPVDWYHKKNSTVEKSTYGSEFFFTHTCVEHIIDFIDTLQYLGVTIFQKSYMFVENKYVVDSIIQPHANIHKRQTGLSFRGVREAIASKMVFFYHVYVGYNPDDILLNHCRYTQIWGLLQPLLF